MKLFLFYSTLSCTEITRPKPKKKLLLRVNGRRVVVDDNGRRVNLVAEKVPETAGVAVCEHVALAPVADAIKPVLVMLKSEMRLI